MNSKELKELIDNYDVKSLHENIEKRVQLMVCADYIREIRDLLKNETYFLPRALEDFDMNPGYFNHIMDNLEYAVHNIENSYILLKGVIERVKLKERSYSDTRAQK